MSTRLAIYTQAEEPIALAKLLAALEPGEEQVSWVPRRPRGRSERRWRAGTLVCGALVAYISNQPVGDAHRRELLEFYPQAPTESRGVLAGARRTYVVEADERPDLAERAAAAVAELTGGVIVVDATGDLLDTAGFRALYGSNEQRA